MIVEITKIRPYKESRKEGIYLMIEMKDIKTNDWFRTYLVPGYRNYDMWRKKARLGNKLHFMNLKMVDNSENIIDADTIPILFIGRQTHKQDIEELRKFAESGSFG